MSEYRVVVERANDPGFVAGRFFVESPKSVRIEDGMLLIDTPMREGLDRHGLPYKRGPKTTVYAAKQWASYTITEVPEEDE